MPRKPIVGGNWKCNPDAPEKLDDLVKNYAGCDAELLSKCDVYVCPSNLHVGIVYEKFSTGIIVSPQNCNFKGCGAYTGEMSVDQMVAMKLPCCLIGHSERRGEFGLPTPPESNELLATKAAYIIGKGLTCVFCIGEPLPIREKGLEAIMAESIIPQLSVLIPLLKGLEDKSKLVIAYEPVWAIGTGVTASPEQAQETHKAIREWIAKEVDAKTAEEIRIQYGGSANAKNAPDLSAQPDIDGFLVGGASLKPEIMDVIKAIAVAKSC
jgi:triosephosphate isomerase